MKTVSGITAVKTYFGPNADGKIVDMAEVKAYVRAYTMVAYRTLCEFCANAIGAKLQTRKTKS